MDESARVDNGRWDIDKRKCRGRHCRTGEKILGTCPTIEMCPEGMCPCREFSKTEASTLSVARAR